MWFIVFVFSFQFVLFFCFFFFFSSRRRHTRWPRDWSSDVCSSDLVGTTGAVGTHGSRMDDVVTGSMLREHRDSSVTVDAFGRVDIPLCPAIVGDRKSVV